MKDLAAISGAAVMPPKWSLGYMQSHRELVDKDLTSEQLILNVVDTFREKKIPLDAVIYLGTGFTPTGWNTRQPHSISIRESFERDPKAVLDDLHAKNAKVIVHMVPWQRDRLPSLQGTIPAQPGETLDASHIESYWQQHVDLVNAGVDAWWPDEGDWFNLFERIKRHQLYYQGPLSTQPNVRPWSLHRNGHLGVAHGAAGSGRAIRSHLEDARGPDRGRNQPLAQPQSVLGLRHGRLLHDVGVDGRALRPLVSVLGFLSVVSLARPHLAPAFALGLGPERHGFREGQTDPADRIGNEQPGDRADLQNTPSCATG